MAAQAPSRLYRSRSQKMIAGVCGGLGDYFDVDPVLIRLMFVVTTFISGAGILAYIILWIVVPFEGEGSARMDTLKRDFDDLTGRVRQYIDPARPGAPPASGQPAPGDPDVSGYHGGFGAGGVGASAYGPSPQTPGPYAPGPYGQGQHGPGPHAPGPHGSGFGAPARGPGASASGSGPATNPTGYPAAGPASAASPFAASHSSRDASMPQDTATARIPDTDDLTATASGSAAAGAVSEEPDSAESSAEASDLAAPTRARASVSAPASSTASSPTGADEDPFRLDPPAASPPLGTPPFGSPYGPQGAPPPGTPPFGSPFGGPGAAPGSSPSGGFAWSSAPRDADAGSTDNVPFGAPAAPPTDRKRRRQHWAGAILILIGTLILGNNLGLLWWLEFEYVFPLVLVGIGAWLLLGRGRRG